jgi:3-hydroxyisobutyrate dehydrogenase
MARRLAGAGFEVLGFDLSPAAGERLAGSSVTVVPDVTSIGRRCRIVILMLPDSDAVEAVLLTQGLLAALASGSLIIDMSSSVPQRTRVLAGHARDAGHAFVDAPVSGGVAGAEQGTLTAMVGGAANEVSRARPVLHALASRVIHSGEVGSGHAVKALNNLMSATHLLVTSEALVAARAFGIDLRLALEVVNGSSGRSGSTENKWPNYVLPGTYDSGFSLLLMLKDMRIALELEHAAGVAAPLSESSVALWADAAQDLGPAADHTEIVRWIESRTLDSSAAGAGDHVCQ